MHIRTSANINTPLKILKPHRLQNLHQLEALLSLPAQIIRANIFDLKVMAEVEVYFNACCLYTTHEIYSKSAFVGERVEG